VSGETEKFKGIPAGYLCTNNGVSEIPANGDAKPITLKPIIVTALSKDSKNNNWGTLLEWHDRDGGKHEQAFPCGVYHIQGTELAQELANHGLPIVPGRERALLTYLIKFETDVRLIASPCTGWQDDAFVLPHETINSPGEARIVYQPSGLSDTARAITRGGNLAEWQSGMANASPMVMFYVCAALTAPVKFKLSIEAGGFHAYNVTSEGKTTMLQAAASVWGNGADPAIAGGAEVYIQRWNATSNALEAKAEAFNDLVMIVDEIGEGDPREFGRTIYRIFSGTGRGRADRSGGLRDSKSWRVTVLSAGEVAISEYIESGGGKVKGGQLVRMVDLDLASIGKLFNSADEADAMKKLCAAHYGHAGPVMIERVTDLASGWKSFNPAVIGEAETAVAKRVRQRFALVAYTGILAANAEILPWTKEQIIQAVQNAYHTWYVASNVVSDTERGVAAVRDFVLKHASRFETDDCKQIPHNRAGWIRDGMYHFTSEAFKEACAGMDFVKVKKALRECGLLHSSKGLNSNIRINGVATSVTSVLGSISGIGSISPHSTTVSADTTSKNEMVSVVSQDRAATTDTTCKPEVVSAENPINKGLQPPIPLKPPKNSNPCSTPDFTDISTGNGEALLPQLEAKGVKG
jgi:putative DNA primase/helicase